MAGENAPRRDDGAAFPVGTGFMDRFVGKELQAFLNCADRMGIPIQPHPVSPERFESLLVDSALKSSDRRPPTASVSNDYPVNFCTLTAQTLNSGILASGSKASESVSTLGGFSPK